MQSARGFQFLLSPGPTPVPDRVLNAMHRQSVDFNGPEFVTLSDNVFEDVKAVFQTKSVVHIYTSNGHGGWEGVLANLLSPGDEILIPEVGVFSEGWRDMAQVLGIVCRTVPNDWRTAIDANRLEEALRADVDRKIKAVLFTHVDTATGIVSDVKAARQAIDAAGHPALFCVDAIASLATTDLPMDAWNVDVVVGASQKGLMMPPGLGLVAANDRAMEASKSATLPRRYFDWQERIKGMHYQRYAGTAPEHHIFGLREVLDMIAEEGLQNVFARHRRLADAVRAAVEVWTEGGAFELNAVHADQRSDSVTSMLAGPGLDVRALQAMGRPMNLYIGSGAGSMNGTSFRIGHMGFINEPMILGSLAAIELVLTRAGVPIGKGAMDAAIASLAAAEPARTAANAAE